MVEKIIQKLNSILEKFEKFKKIISTYVKYKTFNYAFNQFMDTKSGKDFAMFILPEINPLLGPDKVPQFLIDLVGKPPQEIIKQYNLDK